MRSLLLLLVAVLPASAEDRKPGLEIRVKSVADLAGYFEYIGGLAGQGEQGKQFAELVKAFGGAKGVVEGVNLKKPIGGYAVFSDAVVDSQFVVMIPVADEKAFVNLLKTRLSLDPVDDGDGVWKLSVPKVAPQFFFRVHEGYACITVLDPKHIKPALLLDPKAFFDVKDDALVSIALHIDRVPAEFRKVMLGELELKLADKFEKDKDEEAAVKLGNWLAKDGGMRAAKCIVEEGRMLSLKLNVMPKTDDVSLTLTLTAQDGSDFQKTLNSLPAKPALAALAASAESPVASVAINAAAPESMRKTLSTKIQDALDEAAKKAPGDKEAVAHILEVFAPTLKAGEYQLGLAITGEPRDGKLRLVAAAQAKDGKAVEKLAKDFATFIPEEAAKFEFDVAKIPGGGLHKVSVINDDLKRLYGSETVWAGITENLFVIAFGPDDADAKKVANLKAATAEMIDIRLAGTRFLPLVDPSVESRIVANAIEDVFGMAVKPGADEARLTVSGSEKLTVKFVTKGKLIEFLTKVDAKKKGN